MELGVTVITIIIISICLLPFVFLKIAKMKHQKQQLNALSAIAGQKNCHITQRDFMGHSLIGIDESNNYLFFIKEQQDRTTTEQILNLNEIKHCDLIKTNTKKELRKLGIGFKSKGNKQSTQTIELYDYENDFQLSDELEKAKKWIDIINATI